MKARIKTVLALLLVSALLPVIALGETGHDPEIEAILL